MNQPGILIIGVIYNTYPETLRYLDSLLPLAKGDILLILVDNSDKEQPHEFTEKIKSYPFLHYLRTNKNLGYFGGAREGLKHYFEQHATYPPWILVTNVDIVFTPQFFQRLTELNSNKNENLGVVAPSIISQKWNTDYNPKILVRYSKGKLQFYKYLYTHFLIHNLYLIAAYAKKWGLGLWRAQKDKKANPIHKARKIYAPHGSCLVFKDTYFIRGGTLDLPNFLFGEEILVAETAAEFGMDVEYHTEIVIHDYEHASTGFFVTPKMNEYNRQAIQAILERYYC
jgi:GT2 family glycosyltransferase